MTRPLFDVKETPFVAASLDVISIPVALE
jgi:hypothetical protein